MSERDIKRICLVTWYGSINYGTNLQAYALYKTIQRLGYEVDIIRPFLIRKQANPFPGQKKSRRDRFKKLVKRFIPKYRQEIIREERIFKFLTKEFTFSILVDSNEAVDKLNAYYDKFITGSDQIWNPYTLDTFYMLDFVTDDQKKIAYSSSIAVPVIPNKDRPTYLKYLSVFKNLSCRENEGAKLISDLTGRECCHVLDPVLLLSKQDWMSFASNSRYSGNTAIKEYMFCYFIGDKAVDLDAIEDIRRKLGIKHTYVFSVTTGKHIIPNAKYMRASDIYDFVWFLNNATYVCTDSFHCMAMSTVLNKPFVSFFRCKDDEKSENSRIRDFLEPLELKCTIYKQGWNSVPIDFGKVNNLLEKLKENSMSYLKNSLS